MKDTEKMIAGWIQATALGALLLVLIAFFLYSLEIFPGSVPVSKSAETWAFPSKEYREVNRLETESLWMFRDTDSYALVTAALALLATSVLPALIVLIVVFLRRREWLYGVMGLGICTILLSAVFR